MHKQQYQNILFEGQLSLSMLGSYIKRSIFAKPYEGVCKIGTHGVDQLIFMSAWIHGVITFVFLGYQPLLIINSAQ